MCSTCGCGEGERKIEGDEHHHKNHHDHGHDHEHSHDHHHGGKIKGRCVIIHHHHYHGDVHNHYYALPPKGVQALPPKIVKGAKPMKQNDAEEGDAAFQPEVNEQDLHYGQGAAGTHAPGIGQQRLLQIEMDVLSKNNHLAEHNREHFNAQNILALNLVSSPGSGKTTLLTATLNHIGQQMPCAVIEGDQQTTHDAERIRATGVAAIQVNTGKGCHLDAQMVHDAAHRLQLADNTLLFIENVGNLVCPAGFDLGERAKVAVLSVTEGEDKPLKYPHMFAASSLMIVNKIDLLPYLDFNLEACVANARRVNPEIQVIALSARTGEGMEAWLDWLEAQRCA
ncbi:hydrogenase nickel incorporation protein HypB|uniref:Hydrogenase maturation factor HypB n=2 Tax=Enterobacterales TaxID=91347 RepID=A0A366I9N2_9GAMM|nr:hydrogenase nickel incorporation protein HypB [Brenneria salicis]NMN91088.1 hydrogenase nickel incorporation protein HypB [Brenneria salicis ATCC 15712 = DSM 30166]RBP66586.1 hydrogenase nickel incorporation protein HypB [Brenneria salicis ATCC 15712 = DSM 30166]RLM31970.1 hydrogenase accessory protein HypB [Brenneria salicis ATCC 15712 = DSM 30166]